MLLRLLLLVTICKCANNEVQKGELIGYRLHPNTEYHVDLIRGLRDSDEGYLFWSGKISLDRDVMILVPLTLKAQLLEAVQNASIPSEVAFDPVTMDLNEIDAHSKGRSFLLAASAATAVAKKALEMATPFIDSATSKLHNEIFGSGRASRSTDVVIYNQLDKTFRLVDSACKTGIWTSTLLPEFEIPARRSVIYGSESHGFLTGCTGCRAKYVSTDEPKATFAITTSNPFTGKNHVEVEEKSGLEVTAINGGGNNNVVHVTLH